jgi:hypothetical protein
VRKLVRGPRRDVSPVAEHRHRVGERGHLLEPVADEDDRDAAVAQPANGHEEVVHLERRERRGRLVHDQEPGAGRECLGDLHQLPVGDAEASHRRVRGEVDPELLQQLRDCGAHRAPVDGVEATARLAAREDVLRHRQIGEDGRLLVHRDDPESVRIVRAADSLRLALEEHLAIVRMDDPGQDLYERRLPCAVFADERVHGPGLDREADAVEGLHAPVALRDSDELDERAHRG